MAFKMIDMQKSQKILLWQLDYLKADSKLSSPFFKGLALSEKQQLTSAKYKILYLTINIIKLYFLKTDNNTN